MLCYLIILSFKSFYIIVACINLEDFEDCNYWADVGECAKNPVWMHERCFQSCGCQLPGNIT